MHKFILMFVVLVHLTTTQAEENPSDIGNPAVDATFDVCTKQNPTKASLFQKMMKPPYSCDLNFEPQNRAGRSTVQYKDRYKSVYSHMLRAPNIMQNCAMTLVFCIEGISGMKQENKEIEIQKMMKSFSLEQSK